MFMLDEVVDELHDKLEEKHKLATKIHKEKTAMELAEAQLWGEIEGVDNRLTFTAIKNKYNLSTKIEGTDHRLTDKAKTMMVKNEMLTTYPQTYENLLIEKERIEDRIEFLYEILNLMRAFGVDEIGG